MIPDNRRELAVCLVEIVEIGGDGLRILKYEVGTL